jgi:hypothetical protein
MRACEVHACEVHVIEVHAHEVHAYEVHAHEVHAYEVHAYEVVKRRPWRRAHLLRGGHTGGKGVRSPIAMRENPKGKGIGGGVKEDGREEW